MRKLHYAQSWGEEFWGSGWDRGELIGLLVGVREVLAANPEPFLSRRAPDRPDCAYYRRVIRESPSAPWYIFTFFFQEREGGDLWILDCKVTIKPRP